MSAPTPPPKTELAFGLLAEREAAIADYAFCCTLAAVLIMIESGLTDDAPGLILLIHRILADPLRCANVRQKLELAPIDDVEKWHAMTPQTRVSHPQKGDV